MALWMISAQRMPPSPSSARARLGTDSGNMGIFRPIADQTRPLFHRTLLRLPIGTADWRLPNAATANPDPDCGRAVRGDALSTFFYCSFGSFGFPRSPPPHRWENCPAWILHCSPHMTSQKAIRVAVGISKPPRPSQHAISSTSTCRDIQQYRACAPTH